MKMMTCPKWNKNDGNSLKHLLQLKYRQKYIIKTNNKIDIKIIIVENVE